MTRITAPAEQFAQQLRDAGLPEPEREFRFHPTRKWRFDFCWPECKVAVEVEGGIFKRGPGGHTSITGIKRDIEKINAAQLLGWRVFRFHAQHINDDEAVPLVRQAMEAA